jgi:hypothetical protein
MNAHKQRKKNSMTKKEKRPTKSTADKLIQRRENSEAAASQILENVEDYKKALNAIAASPNGSLVFKTLIKASGVFTPSHLTDALALIDGNAKRNFYLELIRPHLEPSIRQELEN